MPAPSFASRVIRLQFSLRALLLLMVLVGGAIAIYRWPWVETKVVKEWDREFFDEHSAFGDEYATRESGRWESLWYEGSPVYPRLYLGNLRTNEPEYQVTTTYRRGWNGKPQRHGHQQIGRLSSPPQGKFFKHKYYVDDDLRRTVIYDSSDQITFSESRLNGLPHGEFVSSSIPERRERGRYEHGKRVGVWQTSFTFAYGPNAERVDVEKSYHQGLLHGPWIWRTPQGRVLQTARYEMGQLIEWNGSPKREALEQLLQECGQSDDRRQEILRVRDNVRFTLAPSSDNLLEWKLLVDGNPALPICASPKGPLDHWYPLKLQEVQPLPDESLLQTLLETALVRNATLTVREKQLFVVKICGTELDPARD